MQYCIEITDALTFIFPTTNNNDNPSTFTYLAWSRPLLVLCWVLILIPMFLCCQHRWSGVGVISAQPHLSLLDDEADCILGAHGLLYLSDSRLKEKTCRKFVEPEVVGLKPTTNHLTTINKFLFLPDGAMILYRSMTKTELCQSIIARQVNSLN